MLLLGNLISLVGCSLMIIIGFIKKKDHILLAQCGQFSIQAAGNLVLGSVSGGISCVIAVIRIVVFKYVRVTVWLKLAFIGLQAVLTAMTGAHTIIQWIPCLSMVAYTWYLDSDSAVTFKIANMAGVVMWAVHDFHYSNFVAFAFDIMTIVSTLMGIWLILREQKKDEQIDSNI